MLGVAACRTFRIASGFLARSPGLPPTRPWLRAVRRPALVRSAMTRSSWATAPSTCRENMPCGVVVSTGSCRLRKWAPLNSMLLDHREQVADGAGEAIEPDHDQGLAPAP